MKTNETKTETKIRKLRAKAYRIAKSILAKHNRSYRKNELGNIESYNRESHEFYSFSLTVDRVSSRYRKPTDQLRLFVSVTVGYKKEYRPALWLSGREQTVFTVGNNGGVTLWNAAKKNGKAAKTTPKGTWNVIHHPKC
jgi:hypothetical protein